MRTRKVRSHEVQREQHIDVGLKTARSNLKNLRKWSRELAACRTTADRMAVMARYHFRGGQTEFKIGDSRGALLHYSRALELCEDPVLRGQCHARLGLAAFRVHGHTLASEHFARALAAGEGNTVLHAAFARSLQELNAPREQVAEQYQAALSDDSKNAWALSWYALALSEWGEHSQAEENARRAVALRSGHSALLTNLARVLVATGEPPNCEAAEKVLEEAVANAPVGFHGPRLMLEELRGKDEANTDDEERVG